jgi:hypothetical protein
MPCLEQCRLSFARATRRSSIGQPRPLRPHGALNAVFRSPSCVLPSADSLIDGAARIRHPNVALVSSLGRTWRRADNVTEQHEHRRHEERDLGGASAWNLETRIWFAAPQRRCLPAMKTRPCAPGKINAPPRLTSQNISLAPFRLSLRRGQSFESSDWKKKKRRNIELGSGFGRFLAAKIEFSYGYGQTVNLLALRLRWLRSDRDCQAGKIANLRREYARRDPQSEAPEDETDRDFCAGQKL